MSEKLSPWFVLREDTPERDGVYQVRIEESRLEFFSFWNGKDFGRVSADLGRAIAYKDNPTLANHIQWRGIVK